LRGRSVATGLRLLGTRNGSVGKKKKTNLFLGLPGTELEHHKPEAEERNHRAAAAGRIPAEEAAVETKEKKRNN
jgi:hypothetical protein